MGAYVDLSQPFWDLSGHKAPDPKDVEAHLPHLRKLGRIQIEQRSRPRLDPALLRMLRDKVFAVRPDVPLRVYGSTVLDLAFLKELPRVQRLTIEVRERLDNVAALTQLLGLRSLHMTLPKGVDSNILTHIPEAVEELSLQPDDGKPTPMDLSPMLRLKALTALNLMGYEQDLERILPQLKGLRTLGLRSMKKMTGLDAIADLQELRQVRILLGSIYQLEALTKLPKLRHLVLWRILKLAGVEFISQIKTLEGLFLESLSGVKSFPETKRLDKLRVIKLAGMKNLRDFSALERAPALEEFVFQNATPQRPDDFVPVLRNPHLKRGGFGFHKKDDVRQMTELLANYKVDGEVYMYPQIRGQFPGFNSKE